MISRIDSQTLVLSGNRDLKIKPGDVVIINVLKNLTGNKWAIGINGKVFPALSDLRLSAGQTLKAQAFLRNDQLVLKLEQAKGQPLNDILKGLNIPQDIQSQNIVAQLIKNQQPVVPETVNLIKKLLMKFGKEEPRFIRLLTALSSKNFDLSSDSIDGLMQILQFDEENRGQQENANKEKSKNHTKVAEVKESLKDKINENGAQNPSLLHLFNHIQGRPENWLVVPFNFQYCGLKITGNLKILYDPSSNKIARMTIDCIKENKVRWACCLKMNKTGGKASLHTDSSMEKTLAEKKIADFRIKLEKKGFEIDDTIYKELEFNGFEPEKDGTEYKQIDLNL